MNSLKKHVIFILIGMIALAALNGCEKKPEETEQSFPKHEYRTIYQSDGTTRLDYECEYDDKGREIRKVRYDATGEATTYEWEYETMSNGMIEYRGKMDF